MVGQLIEVAEEAVGEAGRRSDKSKEEYSEDAPMKDVPPGWIGGSSGTTGVELNPSDFEAVCGFIHDQFTKE